MKQIDLSGLSFADLREKDKHYVDKTLLIGDLLDTDDSGVYLFVRPRRFGKTTNLTMLDAFFNIRYEGNTWFDGLEISKYPEYERYRNAFPVIHLDLGNAKADTYERFIDGMRRAVTLCFEPHRHLLDKKELRASVRNLFESLEDKTASEDDLMGSVQVLSLALMDEFGAKPIILIDEYDAAVSDAFGTESHEPMMSFLRGLMYASIKGNPYRGMVYVTGVMQIAKQSIFSDLNNIVVNNVFSKKSDERFGFVESEVKGILADFGYEDRFDAARRWYDGYRFGDAEVYNPYSIMYFVSEGCEEKAYWVGSGRDVLIRDLLESITSEKYTEIMKLVTGDSILSDLTEAFPYGVIKRSGKPLYSLMVMSGYLKAVPTDRVDPYGNRLFELSIPNEEVRRLIGELMKSVYPVDTDDFVLFNRAILEEDASSIESTLTRIMNGASYLNLRESTYQAVVMTLVHALSGRYRVKVEAPEGQGRADILLSPKVRGDPYIIVEIKVAERKKDLDARVTEAFEQIHDREYYKGMEGRIILMGLAFWKKIPKARIESVMNGDGSAHPDAGSRCLSVPVDEGRSVRPGSQIDDIGSA